MACTSMYGARTSESPWAFMIDVFISWTSLAINEPETRSRVCPASSLMLHNRWRRISNVTGSTRVGSAETATMSDGQTRSVMLPDGSGSGALRPPPPVVATLVPRYALLPAATPRLIRAGQFQCLGRDLVKEIKDDDLSALRLALDRCSCRCSGSIRACR